MCGGTRGVPADTSGGSAADGAVSVTCRVSTSRRSPCPLYYSLNGPSCLWGPSHVQLDKQAAQGRPCLTVCGLRAGRSSLTVCGLSAGRPCLTVCGLSAGRSSLTVCGLSAGRPCLTVCGLSAGRPCLTVWS